MGAGFGVAGQDVHLGLQLIGAGVRRDQADCRPGSGELLDDPDGHDDVVGDHRASPGHDSA
jgi:hypothetical protein